MQAHLIVVLLLVLLVLLLLWAVSGRQGVPLCRDCLAGKACRL